MNQKFDWRRWNRKYWWQHQFLKHIMLVSKWKIASSILLPEKHIMGPLHKMWYHWFPLVIFFVSNELVNCHQTTYVTSLPSILLIRISINWMSKMLRISPIRESNDSVSKIFVQCRTLLSSIPSHRIERYYKWGPIVPIVNLKSI